MRRGPLIAIAILVIVVAVALVYLGRRGEQEGWLENWYPSLRIPWVPPENRENFRAEAIRLGFIVEHPDGTIEYHILDRKNEFDKLLENFGGHWENDDPFMTFSLASEPAADEPVGDWMTQRKIWTVPPENVDEFRKEERTRGFVVEHPDGTIELCIRGRENEFKELVENFGGEWTGDVTPVPEGGLVTDEERLEEIRSRVENLMGVSGGAKLDNAEPSLVPASELQVVEAAAGVYQNAWAYMKTTGYDYRGHTCHVNIPARVDLKEWSYHFNLYNNHLVQSMSPFKGIETGVGWVNVSDWSPGLYIYCAVDGYPVVSKEIPEGVSRDITLFVETYGTNSGYMYVYDPYSGMSLSYSTTVTALNSLAVVQQEAVTYDCPNWIDTSHHHAKIYPNQLKNNGNSWVWWNSSISTEFFGGGTNLPLMEEHGYEDPSYSIYTWSQFQHDFSLETLYKLELRTNLYLWSGSKLWLQFTDYHGEEDWGKVTIWEGTTPAWVNQVDHVQIEYWIEMACLMLDDPPNTVQLAVFTAPPVRDVDVSISPSSQSGYLGDELSYIVTVTNNGNVDDTYDLRTSGGSGWSPLLNDYSFFISHGSSKTTWLRVIVPSGGTSTSITVTATSQADPTASGSASCTAIGLWIYGVAVSISPPDRNGAPGSTVNFTLTVANTGDVDDTYWFILSDWYGWTLSVSPTNPTVPAGESRDAILSVTIPGGASIGTEDRITVSVLSEEAFDLDFCYVHVVHVFTPGEYYGSDDADSSNPHDKDMMGSGRSFLKFDLSDIPYGTTISSASLRLRVGGSPHELLYDEASGRYYLITWPLSSVTCSVYEVEDDSWDEETITSQPACGDLIGSYSFDGKAGQPIWAEWDVTSWVQSQISGDGKASFCITYPSGILFASKELLDIGPEDARPYLDIL